MIGYVASILVRHEVPGPRGFGIDCAGPCRIVFVAGGSHAALLVTAGTEASMPETLLVIDDDSLWRVLVVERLRR
jgi:hypothetical protein